jgi:hypothetical protein
MSLLALTSDMGRGYQSTRVYVESGEIAAIKPIRRDDTSSDNRSIITLKSGEQQHVIEQPERIAALAKEAK